MRHFLVTSRYYIFLEILKLNPLFISRITYSLVFFFFLLNVMPKFHAKPKQSKTLLLLLSLVGSARNPKLRIITFFIHRLPAPVNVNCYPQFQEMDFCWPPSSHKTDKWSNECLNSNALFAAQGFPHSAGPGAPYNKQDLSFLPVRVNLALKRVNGILMAREL